MDYFPEITSKIIPIKKEPIALTDFYYQYLNEENKVCLIDKNTKITEIEKIVEECCLRNNIQLKNLQLTKEFRPFLTCQVENVKIRFHLKLGNKLEIQNLFFSRKKGYSGDWDGIHCRVYGR